MPLSPTAVSDTQQSDRQSVELIADDVIRCLNPLKELIAALKKDDRYRHYDLDIRRINEIESQVNHYELQLEQYLNEENVDALTGLLSEIFYRFHSSFIQMRKPR
jgi:hypothetical protein